MSLNLRYDCSEETAREIDQEAKRTPDEARSEATGILVAHRDQLDAVVAELIDHETLDGANSHRMIGQPAPRPAKTEPGEAAARRPA